MQIFVLFKTENNLYILRYFCFEADNVSIEQHGEDINFREYKCCIAIYVKGYIEAYSLIAQFLSAILGKHINFLIYRPNVRDKSNNI